MREPQPVIRQRVLVEVVAVLRDILVNRHAPVWGSARLTEDLGIISDDLSFQFVPDLEKRLGVNVPVRRWLEVNTVDEAVALLSEYVEASQDGPPQAAD